MACHRAPLSLRMTTPFHGPNPTDDVSCSLSDNNNNNNSNLEALIEALSVEWGHQPLTTKSHREIIQSIVTQQKEQVSNLMECQMEN
ncbi:hypothetical protein HJC23_001137 [Cyclotella cryptica]|uniref:Uncharacterized protein n=1 Tax=Cyclotella cryptica TaxID=29204 RepID=A0ABD3PID7_9STRA